MANGSAMLGKTTPRWIEDLLDYDPTKPKKNGRNLLVDDAPKFRGKSLPRTGIQDCRHSLMKKPTRTNAPVSPDQQPDGARYDVRAYCTKCHCHFDIGIDYAPRDDLVFPCKLSDPHNPLHHLRCIESMNAKEYNKRRGSTKYDTIIEAHKFECSGIRCPLTVNVKICPPKLSKEMMSPILDHKKLYERGVKVIKEDPERFNGYAPIVPDKVLANLRQYLLDAIKTEESEPLKKIAKRNKKLLLGFADDCDSLFLYLDFTVVSEAGTDVVRAAP